MRRSPPWSRDELILAFDLYMRRRTKLPNTAEPEVTELSVLLRQMAGEAAKEFENYRSADAVLMKLANLQSIDPEYLKAGKKSLPNGAQGDEDVWADFANRPKELHEAALAIRAAVSAGATVEPTGDDSGEDDDEAPEGRILARMHKRRERSRKLINKKKTRVLKETGKLACEACSFEFKAYGDRGADFIEVHHTKPVYELLPDAKTKLEDLAVLCANCHRILHRKRPWLTLAELKIIAPDRHG